jgi:integrase
VRTALQYLTDIGVFTKEIKTATSDRTIRLPKQAFERMKEYMRWQNKERLKMGDRWEDNNRIFTQYNGKSVHPDSIVAGSVISSPRLSYQKSRYTA